MFPSSKDNWCFTSASSEVEVWLAYKATFLTSWSMLKTLLTNSPLATNAILLTSISLKPIAYLY